MATVRRFMSGTYRAPQTIRKAPTRPTPTRSTQGNALLRKAPAISQPVVSRVTPMPVSEDADFGTSLGITIEKGKFDNKMWAVERFAPTKNSWAVKIYRPQR